MTIGRRRWPDTAVGAAERLVEQARQKVDRRPPNYQAAIALLSRAINLAPTEVEAYLLQATCYVELGSNRLARTCLDDAERLSRLCEKQVVVLPDETA